MRSVFYLLIIAVLGLAACNDDAILDTSLLVDDEADVQFKNDFSITAKTLLEDSITVYTPNTEYTNYPFGTMLDPIFGKVSSSMAGQLRLVSPQVYPDFADHVFDSVVLSLAYSNDGSYGNTNEEFELNVFRLTDDINADETYYSDQVFATEMEAVGNKTFTPHPSDSVDIKIYREGFVQDSLYKRAPHERINLDFTFGKELYDLDTMFYENITDADGALVSIANDELLTVFKGLQIQPVSENGGLLGFDLRSAETRLTLYYKTSSGPEEFNFYFTEISAKTLHFEHDVTNAPIEAFINNESMGDSLVYVQGMSGPLVEIGLPNIITELGNVIINKAELELYVAEIDDPSDNFALIEQLIVLEQVDTLRVFIEDVVLGLTTNSIDDFGGTVRTDASGVQKYTMNVSTHIQDMLDGTAGTTLFVQPFPKPSNFSRVVFYGANHSTYPMRLKVTYTQL